MDSRDYEELCRRFLAKELRVEEASIQSGHLSSAIRPDLAPLVNQIDLYWFSSDGLSSYFNIANAKWRTKDKVDQPEVLLLQQVRTEVSANKAVMITNTDFTDGARNAGVLHRIGLHIVRPPELPFWLNLREHKLEHIEHIPVVTVTLDGIEETAKPREPRGLDLGDLHGGGHGPGGHSSGGGGGGLAGGGMAGA